MATNMTETIVQVLKENEHGLTLAQLSEIIGTPLNAGHISAALRAGTVVRGEEDEIVMRPATKTVKVYAYANSDSVNGKDGKPLELSDKAKEVLAAAKEYGKPFTISELSMYMNTPIATGTITGLRNKGNLVAIGEKEVEYLKPTPVAVYFAK